MSAIQRTDEWFAARIGRATASRFKDVLARVKNGEAASRRDYRSQLVVERLTGAREEGYTNAAMQWGIDHEDDARAMYGAEVMECGFIAHPTLMAGASPDGFVGDDGLVEIKCPKTATHIDMLLAGKMPSEHIPQVQGQMWIVDKSWCDLVSYDPRLPIEHQLVVYRIHRDEQYIAMLKREVKRFLDEVDETVNRLAKRGE
jgi:hypothetical protein